MFHGYIPHIMGTRFDILLIHPDPEQLNNLWLIITKELELLDRMLNRFNPKSEVAQLNEQISRQPVQVSTELWDMLQLCQSYYQSTLHLFDITLKDFSQVVFHTDCSISSANPDLSFDFGGFAKGYVLKKIKKMLLIENIQHAFINFGNSSIMGIGHHPYGDCWKVSFLNPYNQTLLNEFELRDATLSTSGNTQQYTGHIINPLTGVFDVEHKASTIIASDPLDAEVLSTVWMIADENQRKLLSERFKDIQGSIYNTLQT